MASRIVGIFTGDLHWSERPPVARSCEEDWLGVQSGYMAQLRPLAIANNCPVFAAGDLFNAWLSSPRLISWAIGELRHVNLFGIPGNHDLPNHSYKDLGRSAYWTLVEAGVLKNLSPAEPTAVGSLLVSAFPHGFPVKPPLARHSLMLSVALVHSYAWTRDTGHPGADPEARLGPWLKRTRGYDAVFVGDNHRGFLSKGPPWFMNCGAFVRRNADERKYRPRVGLLHEDGGVTQHFLDTSGDKFLEITDTLEGVTDEGLRLDLTEFAEGLAELHREKLDFAKVVMAWAKQHNLPDGVRLPLLRAVGVKE